MYSIRTILHPTDFSPPARKALEFAGALARDHGARLILLHVYAPLPVVEGDIPMLIPDPADLEEGLLKQLCALPTPGGGVVVEHYVKNGDPAAEILGLAQETNSDLIVMGTRGATGITRLLTGSVAEQVLRKALCPVVTVNDRSVSSPQEKAE